MRGLLILTFAELIVIAQPVLGWHAIPAFFNYSTLASILLGISDALLVIGAAWLAFYVEQGNC